MTGSNSETKKVKYSTIMGSGPFIRGWKDYMKGRPFAVDKERENYQWRYERGRLFACYVVAKMGEDARKKTFKQGRHVPTSAIQMYIRAAQEGYVL